MVLNATAASRVPAVTILIEWENAQDVEDVWVQRALVALQDELERQRERMGEPARVLYLFDPAKVSADDIRRQIDKAAPRLATAARPRVPAGAGTHLLQAQELRRRPDPHRARRDARQRRRAAARLAARPCWRRSTIRR